jgi:Flp pilus assembly protein TadB
MPIGVVAFVMVTNPMYLKNMAADPDGRLMIYGALAGQVVGYFAIQKIISIKV